MLIKIMIAVYSSKITYKNPNIFLCKFSVSNPANELTTVTIVNSNVCLQYPTNRKHLFTIGRFRNNQKNLQQYTLALLI